VELVAVLSDARTGAGVALIPVGPVRPIVAAGQERAEIRAAGVNVHRLARCLRTAP
jgi:hypothetical protein